MRKTLAAMLLLSPLAAARPACALLQVGDKAPPLKVTDWVQGKPFDIQKDGKGKVILLEFWATWCAPCIQIIPDTNELARRYKDNGLVVIGVTDAGQGQTLRTVQDFVASQGKRMRYRVAFDSTQESFQTYVTGTGGMGIPHAVVIGKDGKIKWIGHPADPEMRETIIDLLLDRYDPAKMEKRAAMNARIEPLLNELYSSLNAGDWAKSMSLTDAILAIDPANMEALQLRVIVMTEELDSTSDLRSWARDFITKHADDSDALAKLAGLLMAMPDITDREPALALQAAEQAYKADGKDARVVQTLASVYFGIGDVDAAVNYQEKAVEVSNPLEQSEAREYLEFYKTCQKLAAKPASG